MTLKVIQLSDCHLRADPAVPYRGQDADANLHRVWRQAQAWNPDIVLLTGDLSEDASRESYRRLRHLVSPEVPVLALPGNHDEPEAMMEFFPEGPWEGPLAFEAGSWLLICLDSKLPGRIEGGISDEALKQLRRTLSASPQPNVLLALHHQPVPVGAGWIDRYPLTRPESFLEIVKSEPRVRSVVWGHIHHHFEARLDGKTLLGSPSTAANSLKGSVRFDHDPAGPACRTLELADSGEVKFGILYGGMN